MAGPTGPVQPPSWAWHQLLSFAFALALAAPTNSLLWVAFPLTLPLVALDPVCEDLAALNQKLGRNRQKMGDASASPGWLKA